MLDTQLDDVPMVLAELGNSRNHKRCKDFKTLLLKSQEHGRIADIPFIDENTLLFNKSLLVIQLLLCVLGNWSGKLSETTQLRVRPKVQTEKPELSKQSICDAFISSI
ncbi:hypothetical protein T4A_3963 [Trichinella pseudospiralis]|uniref:Uncharacterized protein n=1 Tax=Trichinella pseudospiralis TaxID=6337 RepID=A0A0V1DYI1_TRIPS|nr:hypothetical protein T4A_3963 [Trichinella pseudospiralis]